MPVICDFHQCCAFAFDLPCSLQCKIVDCIPGSNTAAGNGGQCQPVRERCNAMDRAMRDYIAFIVSYQDEEAPNMARRH